MRGPRAGALLLLAACLAGCESQFPNPFANQNQTVTPGAGAALLVTSDVWSTRPGAPHELYAVAESGSGLTRLTFCNGEGRACDSAEAAVGRDRDRVAVRRIDRDADRDGRLTPADGAGVVFVDLARGLEGTLLEAATRTSGLDWSPVDEILVYSGISEGGLDDLFRMDVTGANNRRLTNTPAIAERRPRIDPTGSVAVFERISGTGAAEVWIFTTTTSQARITEGGAVGDVLPGTPYRVGSDADPDYSPDGRSLVFRRLTALGIGGLGAWDLMTVRTDGSELRTLASGPAYRGAPDWGPQGIVFEEVDEDGRASLLLLAADGSQRQTLASVGAGFRLSFPRWLQ